MVPLIHVSFSFSVLVACSNAACGISETLESFREYVFLFAFLCYFVMRSLVLYFLYSLWIKDWWTRIGWLGLLMCSCFIYFCFVYFVLSDSVDSFSYCSMYVLFSLLVHLSALHYSVFLFGSNFFFNFCWLSCWADWSFWIFLILLLNICDGYLGIF